jgi:CRISPR-associated protein Csb2
MLAFGIRYLNGFVAAAAPDDLNRVEWPPHPGRIFMALAAAHFQTGADPNERRALLWLQALEKDGKPMAPDIVASDKIQRKAVRHYVPVNDKAGPSKSFLQSLALTRDRQARTFARAWLDNDTTFLIWPGVEPDELLNKAFEILCGKVTRIGHSSSLVQMWVARSEEIGEPNWLPNEEQAEIRMRIAVPGTLEHLEQRFNGEAISRFAALKVAVLDSSDPKAQKLAKKCLQEEFSGGAPPQLRPNLSIYQGYARPILPDTCHAMGTVFSPHLIVLQLERDQSLYRHLDLACVLTLTQRWREAILSFSNDCSSSVRSILSGHDTEGAPLQSPHLAFVPLAFVAHEHADGHLLGMGLTLPSELSRNERHEILRVVGHVRQLKLGRLGTWYVKTLTATRPQLNLRADTWTTYPRGATHWATVTPVVFDHHPKSKEKNAYLSEVAAMIKQCCTHVGLPVPSEVAITSVSAHVGVPPTHELPRLHRKDGSPRRHSHAILAFDKPVYGPILLGAGRYRGYGLFRPIHDHADRMK